jgi:hypothetical protein
VVGPRRQAAVLALEFALRVGLVIAVVEAFPQIYTNDAYHFWNHWHTLGLHHLPYRDFLWEFPPITVVPAAAAALFRDSEAFAIFLGIVMAALELATLEILRRSRPAEREQLSLYWVAAALPISLLVWFRLDYMSVVFAAAALVCFERRRPASTFIVLGIFSKLWPGVLLAASAWRRRWREVAITVVASAVLLAAWYAFSSSGFDAFLAYRRGTGFQVESLIGSVVLLAGSRPILFRSGAYVVLAGHYGWVDSAMLLVWLAGVAAVVLVAYRRKPKHDPAVLGALVVGLILSSRLFSPQYLVWVLPFVLLARADGERRATGLFVVIGMLTTVYLLGYSRLLDGNRVLAALIVLRNVLLAVTGLTLLRWGWSGAATPTRPAQSTRPPRRT